MSSSKKYSKKKQSQKNIIYSKRTYSNETTQFATKGEDEDANFLEINGNLTKEMVFNEQAQGVRKVKNFTLTISASYQDNADAEPTDQLPDPPQNDILPLTYALVYVPNNQNDLAITSSSPSYQLLYGINNYVLLTGTIDKNNTICQKTKLARNLNAGDSIKLKIFNSTTKKIKNLYLIATLNYAIAYN